MKFNFKKAFTLAEVLITLGIIGVVAAMTVPSIVNGYQKQVYVTQLKKVYSEFSSVFPKYLSDQRVESMKETDAIRRGLVGLRNLAADYFKSKNCDSVSDCLASEYGNVNGTSFAAPDVTCGRLVTLANGAVACFYVDTNKRLFIEVDVNGKDAPNIYGRDYFRMAVTNDGTVYDYDYDTSEFSTAADKGAKTGAFGKIMADGWKMNY